MPLRPAAYLVALMWAAPALAAERPAPDSPWRTTVVPAGTVMPGSAGKPPAVAAQPVAAPDKAGPEVKGLGAQHALQGLASFYWQEGKTASGETYDKSGLTAAHPTLPFNTMVKVTRVGSDRSVVVRINDRGPFKPGRIIDVSERAAEILGFQSRGLAKVELEVLP